MSASTPLIPGCYYHIYNRGNNREDLFREKRNYEYFLKLYFTHTQNVADTYAYCLMKNHFHFLIRVKEDPTANHNPSNPLNRKNQSRPFSNVFNAYAKSINRAYGRTGALFQRPFGRILVKTDAHFLRLITYIHQNPQKHGFVDDFRDWPFTSFHSLLSDKPTILQRENVLLWFNGRGEFETAHRSPLDGRGIELLAPDDAHP